MKNSTSAPAAAGTESPELVNHRVRAMIGIAAA
jgi:hypothetical protein